MDVLGSAPLVLQNEALTQNRLTTDVNALASGLRVRSASDDPSGYTIAETLQTKVAGLEQSVTNVQTANNLLNVADGALSSIEVILQRIRSLVVESNSDINSQNQLENIQTEIDQLLLEINKISSTVNFNGLQLFTGQFQTSSSASGLFGTVQSQAISETPPYANPATGVSGSNTLVNGTGTGGSSPFMSNIVLFNGQYVPTFTVWSIVSASNNMYDPNFGVDVGPAALIELQAYNVSSGTNFGPTPLFTWYSTLPLNAGKISGSISAPSGFPGGSMPFPPETIFNSVTFGNITTADVGAQAAFLTLLPQQAVNGNPLTVNDGGQEGETVSISLPELNTNALEISGISVLTPAQTTVQPVTQQLQTGETSSSNVVAASYSEIMVDRAIEAINTTRAQVGAQTVALQQDADNDNVAIVNYQASVSNIRDANIGATVTDFTKQQILASVGTSVLSQINVSAQQLTALLLNSFSGFPSA